MSDRDLILAPFVLMPAFFNSVSQGAEVHVKHSSKLRFCVFFTKVFYKYISVYIRALLFWCSPSAIFRKIAFSPVYPVNRGSFRSLSHIFKKNLKIIHPVFSYCNSSPAIRAIFGVLGVGASLYHSRPRRITAALSAFGGMSMPSACCSISAGLRAILTSTSLNSIFRGFHFFATFKTICFYPYAARCHIALSLFNKIILAVFNDFSKVGGRVNCLRGV